MKTIELQPSSVLHANALVVGRTGVLILGNAGSGKSALSDRLINESSIKFRYARWVADDQTKLTISSSRLIAQAAPAISGQAEVHHLGIVQTTIQHLAVVDFVVDLVPAHRIERMPVTASISISFTQANRSVSLPRIEVPEKSAAVSMRLIHHFIRENFSKVLR